MKPEIFGAVCYLVLMDHHGKGYTEASPSYVKEKLNFVMKGYHAFASLDQYNQQRVLDYLERWGIPIPKEVEEYRQRLIDAQEALLRK